ncbi:hypothetical protein F4779DRAFT_594136 [Xylariaceae sp. FL0662B]|nr:hypothetical protein F4779DRAFT_594136 [Xylariaceae sp. FL0662B]
MDTVMRLVHEAGNERVKLYLGVGISAIILAALFVAIRLCNSWRKAKKFLIEDYISILALVLLATEYQLRYIIQKKYERHVQSQNPADIITYITSTEIAQTIISAFLSFFAKIPIFILYIRLFGVVKWVRLVSYLAISATLLQFVAGSSVVIATCYPGRHVLDGDFVAECLRWDNGVVLWNGIIAVVTDIVLFVIPFPIIVSLQLPRNKKTGLAVMFLVGILGIAIGTFSLYWRILAFLSGSKGTLTLVLSTTGECSIAIIIGCVPAIPPLWADYISNTALYLRIRSALSSIRARKSSPSQSAMVPPRGVDNHEINGAYCYVELYDGRFTKAYGGVNHGRAPNWAT